MELLLSRRGHENGQTCQLQSESQVFQNGIKRLGAMLVSLSQGCAGIDEIDTIFQGFQEPEVIEWHYRSDCSATPAQ
jgi:hypothetical protein